MCVCVRERERKRERERERLCSREREQFPPSQFIKRVWSSSQQKSKEEKKKIFLPNQKMVHASVFVNDIITRARQRFRITISHSQI